MWYHSSLKQHGVRCLAIYSHKLLFNCGDICVLYSVFYSVMSYDSFESNFTVCGLEEWDSVSGRNRFFSLMSCPGRFFGFL
jgi:hypothetical protein